METRTVNNGKSLKIPLTDLITGFVGATATINTVRAAITGGPVAAAVMAVNGVLITAGTAYLANKIQQFSHALHN